MFFVKSLTNSYFWKKVSIAFLSIIVWWSFSNGSCCPLLTRFHASLTLLLSQRKRRRERERRRVTHTLSLAPQQWFKSSPTEVRNPSFQQVSFATISPPPLQKKLVWTRIEFLPKSYRQFYQPVCEIHKIDDMRNVNDTKYVSNQQVRWNFTLL